jgi:hypothetical protein
MMPQRHRECLAAHPIGLTPTKTRHRSMNHTTRTPVAIVCIFAFTLAAAAQPNTVPTKVAITPEHVLSINGKKVFPIGFTLLPAPDAKAPNGKLALVEFREAGALLIRTGPMLDVAIGRSYSAWNEDWIEREKQYMNAAARAGMYCMPSLHELAKIDPKRPEKEESLRRVVRMFKNHPGMGVWKGADEPQWGKVPVPALIRAYHVIHEEDPNHPIWIVHAPRGTIDELSVYDPTYDIGGVDLYPVSYPLGVHLTAADTNHDISVIGDYTQKMLRVTEGRKPVWFTLQIAWSGTSGRRRPQRFPTFPQQRFMTYQAIINGARGLVYYGGNLPTTLSDHDRPNGWNWTYWERVLRPVIEEVGDKGPLADALCAANSMLPVKASGNAVELCVRKVGSDLFVLACCRDPQKTAEVQFTGLPSEVGNGEVLFESPRKVTAKDGSFSDWFAPYDVHVYKFTRR